MTTPPTQSNQMIILTGAGNDVVSPKEKRASRVIAIGFILFGAAMFLLLLAVLDLIVLARVLINASGPDVGFRGITGHRKTTSIGRIARDGATTTLQFRANGGTWMENFSGPDFVAVPSENGDIIVVIVGNELGDSVTGPWFSFNIPEQWPRSREEANAVEQRGFGRNSEHSWH
jgi:hypothetical protein